MLVPLLVTIILLVAGAAWIGKRYRNERWARNVALPEAYRLAAAGKSGDAYALAVMAEKSIPGDPTLASLARISFDLSIKTTPPGVDVFSRAYIEPTAPWVKVGTTPLKNIRQPGVELLWKFEKTGVRHCIANNRCPD